MNFCKKLIALLLSLVLTFSVLSLTVSAKKVSYDSYIEQLDKYVDLEDFSEYLYDELYNFSKQIDVSSYNIPMTNAMLDVVLQFIENELVDLFHVEKINCRGHIGRNIVYIDPVYNCTKKEYESMHSAVVVKAQEMVDGIKDNHKLSDAEKALLLHDRIALACEYDYENYVSNTVPWESYTIYGVLCKGVAVCEGYAKTYSYLLKMVGIDSEICSSRRLVHAWNIVYIDGEKYHVDVTWDDPVNGNEKEGTDISGRVTHTNFLLSTSAFKKGVGGSNCHNANDFDFSPVSTKYDKYFWQNSDTAVYLLNDEIYYIDNAHSTLNRYSDKKTLVSVKDIWNSKGFLYFKGNFSRLICDGEKLYFSLSKGVYSFDPSSNKKSLMHSPSGLKNHECIYGLSYENGNFVLEISEAPHSVSLKEKSFGYDKVAPKITVNSTNSVAKTQTVTVNVSDSSEISGYWWGKNSNYKNNKFTDSNDKKITLKVSSSGTYYITVKDAFGNISVTKKLVFSKTTLNSNGGSVKYGYIITLNGHSVKLPTPVREGYNFKGWSTSKTSKSGSTKITPKSNKTYYAIWKIKTEPMLIKNKGVFYYYNKGVKDYSNTLVKYNNNYYHVKGGKWIKDTVTVKYNNKLYYVKNGIAQLKITGYVKVSGKWIYVNKGIVTVEGLKLNKTSISVSKAKTYNLKASGFASSIKVKWKSDNTKVATVTQSGKVKGVKAGTTKITATFTYKGKNFKQTCTVKVKNK